MNEPLSRISRKLAPVAMLLCALRPAAPMAAPARLEIDPGGSEVGFLLHTTWHDVEGKTSKISGAITSDSGDIFTDGRISVEIEAAGLDTGNSRRDRVMKESHLETAKYPRISFVSTAPPTVKSGAPGAGGTPHEISFSVRGDLTIHGTKRDVTLPIKGRREGEVWIFSGDLPVRLSEHGIADPSIAFSRVQDEVTVTLRLKTKPLAPARP